VKRSPLGNTAKTTSIDAANARLERYRLQATARRLVHPLDRLQGCLRWPTGGGNGRVAIKYRRAVGYAYYGGLQTCGQIWKCPVCAARITERRRALWVQALSGKEIATTEIEDSIIVKHISHGFQLAMATFTIQHEKSDRLIDTLQRLERAYQLLWSGRWAVEFKTEYQVIGTVRAMELTYGENGWHPHIHCMFVTVGDGMRYSVLELRGKLSKRWATNANKAGGFASVENGVDFTVADVRTIEYINKLGIQTVYEKRDSGTVSEVTKYPTKTGRRASVGLFGLLALAASDNDISGSHWQLAQAIMKGRRHIATSRGLLRRLGASQELSDDLLAATDIYETGDEMLALLERPQWDIIDRKELRGDLLNVAQTGSREAVQDFLLEVGAI